METHQIWIFHFLFLRLLSPRRADAGTHSYRMWTCASAASLSAALWSICRGHKHDQTHFCWLESDFPESLRPSKGPPLVQNSMVTSPDQLSPVQSPLASTVMKGYLAGWKHRKYIPASFFFSFGWTVWRNLKQKKQKNISSINRELVLWSELTLCPLVNGDLGLACRSLSWTYSVYTPLIIDRKQQERRRGKMQWKESWKSFKVSPVLGKCCTICLQLQTTRSQFDSQWMRLCLRI